MSFTAYASSIIFQTCLIDHLDFKVVQTTKKSINILQYLKKKNQFFSFPNIRTSPTDPKFDSLHKYNFSSCKVKKNPQSTTQVTSFSNLFSVTVGVLYLFISSSFFCFCVVVFSHLQQYILKQTYQKDLLSDVEFRNVNRTL